METQKERPPMSKLFEKRIALARLADAVDMLRSAQHEMPVQQIAVLLWVAENEGDTQVQMREDLHMASSTASRNIAALSDYHRLGKPGLGFVDIRECLEDRRAKRLWLTEKGKVFISALVAPRAVA